jgi:hypothetical protein
MKESYAQTSGELLALKPALLSAYEEIQWCRIAHGNAIQHTLDCSLHHFFI